MVRIILFISILLLSFFSFANMGYPIHKGTLMARPFISEHIDIVKEKILIIPDSNFETAQFIIEYHIDAEKSGNQIPLLFYASDFKEGFRIWLDDNEIELSQVPEAYQEIEGMPFTDFEYLFETNEWSEKKYVLINDSPSSVFYVDIDDLKFFETDFSEGNHTLRVEYVANKWEDHSDWVKEYTFRYVLSPAKYWKSFGDLEIVLDASNLDKTFTTNIGMVENDVLESMYVWTFSSLPTDVLTISYKPKTNLIAATLIKISPAGLAFIFTIVLIIIHLVTMRIYRKNNPNKRFSWVMIIGSLFIPFLALLSYVFAFDFIDFIIGSHAGKYHGYTFLFMFFYPILLPIYWVIMWLIDKDLKIIR